MVEEVTSHDGYESFGGSIMEIFGLLPHTILAGILQPSLNAPLAGPLVTLRRSRLVSCHNTTNQGELHTTGQVGTLTGIASSTSLLSSRTRRIFRIGSIRLLWLFRFDLLVGHGFGSTVLGRGRTRVAILDI